MDLFGKKEIERLNSVIDDYKGLNSQLENKVRELEEFKIKFEISRMLIDDDQAIDELLECKKFYDAYLVRVKSERENTQYELARRKHFESGSGLFGLQYR